MRAFEYLHIPRKSGPPRCLISKVFHPSTVYRPSFETVKYKQVLLYIYMQRNEVTSARARECGLSAQLLAPLSTEPETPPMISFISSINIPLPRSDFLALQPMELGRTFLARIREAKNAKLALVPVAVEVRSPTGTRCYAAAATETLFS